MNQIYEIHVQYTDGHCKLYDEVHSCYSKNASENYMEDISKCDNVLSVIVCSHETGEIIMEYYAPEDVIKKYG